MVVASSYIKMILREFKNSFGRFAAIFGIVALGVGFLSGLLVTTPNMNNSVDKYYDDHNTADIFIKATMGLTEDDLKQVESLENIKSVMPAYVIDKLIDVNNKEDLTAKIYGIPLLDLENQVIINKLDLLEGRMPKNNRECLVERKGPYFKDIKIGSKVKLSKNNQDYEDIGELYHVTEYKVVGVVGNSFHFSLEREPSDVGAGKLDTIIYLDSTSYALEEFTDFYIVLKDTLAMNSFSSEYKVYTEKISEKLEDISKKRSHDRKMEILKKANESISEGFKDYHEESDKARKELADALKEINKAKQELESSAIDIKNAKIELNDARETLEQENKKAQIEISDGEKELNQAKKRLSQAENELKDAKLELEDGQGQYLQGYLDYEQGKKDLEDGLKQIEQGKKELLQIESELLDGKKQLEIGKLELLKAKRELEKGQGQYENGLSELKAGRSEFLYSINPLAKELGYLSSERLMSTASGQIALRSYLIGVNQELSAALAEAKVGKTEIEKNIHMLKVKKQELESNLTQLNLQLQMLEKDSIANAEAIIMVKTSIQQINAGLTEINTSLVYLEAQLKDLAAIIIDLESKQAEIPDYDFLIDTWTEMVKSQRQLEIAKENLHQGWIDYNSALKDLTNSENKIRDAEIKIEEGKRELQQNEKILEEARKDLDEGFKKLKSSKKELESGEEEYQSGLLEVSNGWKDYEIGIAKVEDARKTLKDQIDHTIKKIEDGEKELGQGILEYQDGIIEIEDAEKDYNKAKVQVDKELEKAYNKLLEAEAEVKNLEDPEWYVLDRESNMSYMSFKLNADKVAAISTVFPIFFYLVAGLVALTTMTRMVEEERTQIGVLKALGYKKSTIISKYILYCGLASILGSIVGQLIGFELIPRVIWNTYGVMYHLPEFITDYNKKISLLSSGVAILSTLAATYFAANGALREKPSLLMLARPPKRGKRILLERITPLWSIMTFNLKSTARNIFRYKKHFYMTVIGISGCTALLVTGFGIRNSIKDIGTLQFDQIFKYQLKIEMKKDYTQSDLDSFDRDYKEIDDILKVFSNEGYLEFENKTSKITLVGVEDTNQISDYILFRQRKNTEIIDFSKDTIIISEKIAQELKIKPGDTVIYENSDEIKKEFKVDAIAENYIGNYIYMNKAKYESAFRDKLKNNTIYAKTQTLTQSETDKLIENLYDNDDILNASFISRSRSMFDNLIHSINYIVIVIIIASGLLAFIVLYNLTNININERRRELATLKVLGFHNNEVASYIFREITILALIGTLLGLALGKYLHQFIIVTVEDPEFMFGRSVSILSYLISAIITMMFSAIVDFFMVKKLRNIKMVDSMKAND